MTNKTILILGAKGRLGAVAAKAFTAAGWRVIPFVRPMQLDDPALLRQAAGASVVLYGLNPAYTDKAWQTQALPMLEAAMALTRSLGARLLFPGNVYNYGSTLPAVLTEELAQHADTVKGRVRVAMEQRLAQAARDGELRSLVLRAGNFFGCGTGTLYDRMLTARLGQGRMGFAGPMNVPTPWAYVPDLARCLVELAEREQQLNDFEQLHFSGHQVSGEDWLQAFGQVTGQPVKLQQIPWGLIRMGALLLPTWASLVELRYLWQKPHALDNRGLMRVLGREPHTPFQDAVQGSLA